MVTDREIAVAVLIGVIAGALLPWGDADSDDDSMSQTQSAERADENHRPAQPKVADRFR